MKNILITGENSYIGKALETWLMREPGDYKVSCVKVKEEAWKTICFHDFDVVVHTAAAVHIKESKKNQLYFYEINRDLTAALAEEAKARGVEHFIFLSSMAVYGMNKGFITRETLPLPNTDYGASKLEGENFLRRLQSEDFQVSIVRSPLVYGEGCKGKYRKLSRLVKILPIFPKMDNLRSMIHIDNLTEFIKQIIDNQNADERDKKAGESEIYFPQNREYVNISKLVHGIAKTNGREIKMPQVFNGIIRKIKLPVIERLFFDLQYDMEMSDYKFDYRIVDYETYS